MDLFMVAAACCVFGLIIGSFLSVCIHRLPIGRFDDEDQEEEDAAAELGKEPAREKATRETMSIWRPGRSFCPRCKQQLLWWHNIPLLSWLALRGRCWFCKAPIPIRYPLVELLSGLAALLAFQLYGLTLTAGLVFAFAAALIVITFIDYDFYIIPNLITFPGIAAGFLLSAVNQYYPILGRPFAADMIESLLGMAAGGGFLLLVSRAYFKIRKIEGLGMGDVKLLAMTGAFFGWEASLYTIFVGSLIGSVLGIALVVLRLRSMQQMLPFGPFLAGGTLLYLYYYWPVALSGFQTALPPGAH